VGIEKYEITKMATKIGSGTYGCIYKPSLRCNDDTFESSDNHISKLMIQSSAMIEDVIMKRVALIDPDGFFHHPLRKNCKTDFKPKPCNKKNTATCCDVNDQDNHISELETSNLIYDLGGYDLDAYVKGEKSFYSIRNFYIGLKRLFYGILTMNKYDVYHLDIKPANILVNDTSTECIVKFIDFGLYMEKDDGIMVKKYGEPNNKKILLDHSLKNGSLDNIFKGYLFHPSEIDILPLHNIRESINKELSEIDKEISDYDELLRNKLITRIEYMKDVKPLRERKTKISSMNDIGYLKYKISSGLEDRKRMLGLYYPSIDKFIKTIKIQDLDDEITKIAPNGVINIQDIISKVDVYMLGLSLKIINDTIKNKASDTLDKQFNIQIEDLINKMINPSVTKRIGAEEAYREYMKLVSNIYKIDVTSEKEISIDYNRKYENTKMATLVDNIVDAIERVDIETIKSLVNSDLKNQRDIDKIAEKLLKEKDAKKVEIILLIIIPYLPLKSNVETLLARYYGNFKVEIGKKVPLEMYLLQPTLEAKGEVLPVILRHLELDQIATFILTGENIKYLDTIMSNYGRNATDLYRYLALACINSKRGELLKNFITRVDLPENNHEILRLALGTRDTNIIKQVMDRYNPDQLIQKLMNFRLASAGNDLLSNLISDYFKTNSAPDLSRLAQLLGNQLLAEVKKHFLRLDYNMATVKCLITIVTAYSFPVEDPVYRVIEQLSTLKVSDVHTNLVHSDKLDDDLIYATGDLKAVSGLKKSENYWTQIVHKFLPNENETLDSVVSRLKSGISDPVLRKAFLEHYSSNTIKQTISSLCNSIANIHKTDTDMSLRHILTYAAIFKNLNFLVARTRFMKGEITPQDLATEPLDTCTFPEMRLVREDVLSFSDAVHLVYNVVSENIANVKDLEQIPTLITADLPMSRLVDKCNDPKHLQKISNLILLPYPDGKIYCFERDELKRLLANKEDNPYTNKPFPRIYTTEENSCEDYIANINRGGFGRKRWETLRGDTGHLLCKIETGGDGDCLFYSLGTALVDLYDNYPDIGSNEVSEAVQMLRNNGKYIRKYLSERLRNFLQPKILEMAGNSPDYYKNEDLWQQAFTEEEAQKISKADTEEKAWKLALSTYGSSSHWGTEFDVYMFENVFNVGVIIFNESRKDKKFYYCRGTPEISPFTYYVIINHQQRDGIGLHFQLGGAYNKASKQITSGFDRNDLPNWIIDTYRQECNTTL